MKLSGSWPAIIYYLIPVLIKNLKMHTNASDFQLVAFIIQKGKPISFCSKKLTDDQKSYTVT